jgi:hypothetical protein
MKSILTSYFLLLTSYFLLLTSYFLLLTSYFLLLTSNCLPLSGSRDNKKSLTTARLFSDVVQLVPLIELVEEFFYNQLLDLFSA